MLVLHFCLMYKFLSCVDLCQKNLELSLSMKHCSTLPLSNCIVQDYQKEYCTSRISTINKTSNTKENNSSSPVAIASETNRLLQVYPLIGATQSSLWTIDSKVIQRLQYCLSRNDLTGIVYLVFEVGVAMRQQRKTLGTSCEDAATSAFSLSFNTPQFWISRRNMLSYSELNKEIIHIEVLTIILTQTFL